MINLAGPCRLCGHNCGINRRENEKDVCGSDSKASVYSYSAHRGEEPPISGKNGSGTIFFARCNMKCVYCQNFSFSQSAEPFKEQEPKELAELMLELESLGCHNINLVSPTHFSYQIKEALEIARKHGLTLPIVYNTGGYDSLELIKLFDGIVDVYLPDMRYADGQMSVKYSAAPNYPNTNRLIVKEMFRQVGNLKLDEKGIAQKGLIVRLLILPGNISGTIDTLHFLKNELSQDIYISVMSQYHPTYKANDFPELARRITEKEYRLVVEEVERLGFKNGWIQDYSTDHKRFLGTRIRPGHFDWA